MSAVTAGPCWCTRGRGRGDRPRRRVVAGGGVPAGGDGLAGELERDGPLDGAGGAVAGLPGAEDLPGVLDRDFDAPPGGVPLETRAGDAAVSVVTRARSCPLADLSRMRTTVTVLVPKTEGHRQVMAAALMAAALP